MSFTLDLPGGTRSFVERARIALVALTVRMLTALHACEEAVMVAAALANRVALII